MNKSNRRTFLKTSLAVGGAFALPRFSIGQSGMSPNGKLQIAGIGVGNEWRNRLTRGIANDDRVETVALCDVDLDTLNTEGEKFPNARTFQDFREMLAEMDDEIDAFVIATPDHWHTYLSALALSTGKHVFCEKPLTRTIGEMDALAALAKQHPELATQMGNQGHGKYQEWKEIYEGGYLGEVTEIHVWTSNLSPRYFLRPNTIPPKPDPAPEVLDWDLWLGPAELRPYADRVYHPRTWRGWFDFGSGLMGDVAVHTADAAIYAMSLPQPYRAEVEGEDFSPEYMPKNAIVRLYFKPTNQSKEVVLHWYEDPDDVPRPAALEEGRNLAKDGLYMVGEKASVLGNGMRPGPVIIPDAKRREIGRIPQTLPRFGNHYKTWIESCFDRSKPAVSEFTEAASLMETILVGSLAQRAGHDIEWDSANRRVPGHPEMDKWIRPEYHNGYPTPRYS